MIVSHAKSTTSSSVYYSHLALLHNKIQYLLLVCVYLCVRDRLEPCAIEWNRFLPLGWRNCSVVVIRIVSSWRPQDFHLIYAPVCNLGNVLLRWFVFSSQFPTFGQRWLRQQPSAVENQPCTTLALFLNSGRFSLQCKVLVSGYV